MPIFKVIFKDGSIYNGGQSLIESLWTSIPDKEIKRLEYAIADGSFLVLEDFEAYNHQVEVVKNIYGPNGTSLRPKLENIYIMGLKEGKVISYRISLKGESGSDKYHKGDITKRISELGKEFRGRPTTNWHKGIVKKEVI